MDDSAPWKTKETIVGLPRLLVHSDLVAVTFFHDGLTRMDLGSWRGGILPDQLLVRADHARAGHPREDDIPAGEQGGARKCGMRNSERGMGKEEWRMANGGWQMTNGR